MARYPVSISFGEAELKELDRLAKKFQQTRSGVLKVALQEYLRKLKFKQLREIGKAVAQGKGYFTDQDIYRDIS
ncbi:MAG: hypothetical protein A3G33_02500 [Omnitrophica bacterium RIFCSPLOWO2_12_FULL_44_17]|uniref:Ribbon-helix-helix protein CopG domain-containing protein n=1 Tax=Candidatus Danuiimicrobium aquiferis TaxID=1801832 RepID=A0A1G1KVY0_9BACT|nr:MAG: hypothetical protein A3B72_00385 [Omnitrophica bacterium RIFCSPHIGHO2_02_FULL_45_28]OGW88317.1 MAG: hypothetical protein A3E74_02360 [Omnitrophica bacterium RIFCSPHIGHO2_12_FULL_44_12]OGW97134.1 MAG: hypothetical protein A3G33_02500 [Omnitrophica bacterium RIFCSPLOWO2_12_FULL_44_17]OGX03875.1 MAG: hypothetical protein A3J12_02310 [Omnitrophica bacterium RIFCSPLOWO2_02_FULL_44_11]